MVTYPYLVPLKHRGDTPRRWSHPSAGTLPAQPQAAYLFAVLQTLQDCQVVGPGVLGAKTGQVVPAGLLLCQLPTGRPSRLRGPGGSGDRCILTRRLRGPGFERTVRLGRAARNLQAQGGYEAAETHGRQKHERQRRATVSRHLHITVKLVLKPMAPFPVSTMKTTNHFLSFN